MQGAPLTQDQGNTPRWRRWVTPILVVVTSIAGVGAIVGVWSHQTLFNTDRFMNVVEPTLNDERFYQAAGDWAGNQVVDVLLLEERIAETLGAVDDLLVSALIEALDPSDRLLLLLQQLSWPTLASLAPAIAGPLEERIHNTVVNVVTSDEVATSLPVIVERAHFGLVALARDDLEQLPNVYVSGEDVRVNLLPLIARAMAPVQEQIRDILPDINLPTFVSDRVDEALAAFRQALGEAVPDDFGQLRLMSTDNLETLQGYTRAFERGIWGWVALTVVLIAVTIWTAIRRRRTAVHLVIGMAVALAVAGLIVAYFEGVVLSAFVDQEGTLIEGFLGDVFSGLRTIVLISLAVAVAVAITGHVTQKSAEEATT